MVLGRQCRRKCLVADNYLPISIKALCYLVFIFPGTRAFSMNALFAVQRHSSSLSLLQLKTDNHKEVVNHIISSHDLRERRETLRQMVAMSVLLCNKDYARALEPQLCANGAIISENAVPGAYQQVCMTLPTRSITLESTGEEISITQGTGDGQGVSGRTGVALWNSGLLLTRLLDSLARKEIGFFAGKSVLELGCGTALATIAASKLGAANVVATDGNDEVVKLANLNLQNNNIFPTYERQSSQQCGEAQYLQWGSLDVADFYDTADLVIGSDLTYNSGSWGLLAETFEAVLKPNGIVCYLTLGHAGFNVASELGGFLTLVESKGALEVIKEGSSSWPFQKVPSLDKLVTSSLNSKEREVIAGTGGFKVIVLRKRKRRR